MQNLSIAVVQAAAPATTDPKSNLDRMADLLRQVASRGADLAVFPEASLTGYSTHREEIEQIALTTDSAPFRTLLRVGRDCGVGACFGFYERDGSQVYNSAALVAGGELIGIHRKVHCPPREAGLFSCGDRFEAFDLPFARVGLSICYDNEIPESHLCLALAGAELILMPTAWSDRWEREDYIEPCATDEAVVAERERWMHMMFCARCRDTGTYSALANLCSPEQTAGGRFVGKSMIIAPTGRVLAEAPAWEETILHAELDAECLQAYRGMPAYALRGRRPEVYSPLVAGE